MSNISYLFMVNDKEKIRIDELLEIINLKFDFQKEIHSEIYKRITTIENWIKKQDKTFEPSSNNCQRQYEL